MCFAIFWGKKQLLSFFIQDLHLNFHSFLGFQHGIGSSVNVIMRLLPIATGLKCFWFLIALLLYLKWTILGLSFLDLKIFAYQASFQEDFDKSILSVHTYNLMSKKKLGSFNDLIINTYFQFFICLPIYCLPRYWYEHFLGSIFCKVSLALLNRI